MSLNLLNNIPYVITTDEVMDHFKIPKQHKLRSNIEKLIPIAAEIGKPKAIYTECTIMNRSKDTITCDNVTFHSVALTKNLSSVDIVYPYLCTCGKELSDFVDTIDNMMDRYILDGIMEVTMEKAKSFLIKTLHEKLGYPIATSSIDPGSLRDWAIHEQKKLFRLFSGGEKTIGVTLTDSSLMIPVKSISGFRFITDKEFHNCQLCQRENCISREAPFDEKLYKETFPDEIEDKF